MTHDLDITHDVCPMTWVKTRLELEDLEPGDLLRVRVRAGASQYNVKANAVSHGHEVVEDVELEPPSTDKAAIHQLTIRRGEDF